MTSALLHHAPSHLNVTPFSIRGRSCRPRALKSTSYADQNSHSDGWTDLKRASQVMGVSVLAALSLFSSPGEDLVSPIHEADRMPDERTRDMM